MRAARPSSIVIPVRLSFFYVAFYCAMAIFLPFWPVWLTGKGLDAGEIGLVLAVGMGMRLSPRRWSA